MIQMVVTKAELVEALSQLARLEERGFVASTAIMELHEVGQSISDNRIRFSGHLIMQAVAGDDTKNWGNITTDLIDRYRYKNGKLLEE